MGVPKKLNVEQGLKHSYRCRLYHGKCRSHVYVYLPESAQIIITVSITMCYLAVRYVKSSVRPGPTIFLSVAHLYVTHTPAGVTMVADARLQNNTHERGGAGA